MDPGLELRSERRWTGPRVVAVLLVVACVLSVALYLLGLETPTLVRERAWPAGE